MAKSKAIDRYRQLSKSSQSALDETLVPERMHGADVLMSAEQQRELHAAIHALGEPDREIMIRRHYYRQKPKDIAFVLDIPVKQVENRLYRSKLKLRAILSQE